MLGKNRTKSHHAKRQRVTSRTVMVEPIQRPQVPLDKLMETWHSVIPRKVGSDLSFAKFADEIEPAIFEDIVKCQSLSIDMPSSAFNSGLPMQN
jgi:hypothetical protein